MARRILSLASASLVGFRARIETLEAPSRAARVARERPMPLEPPVMRTWRDLRGIEGRWECVMRKRTSRSRKMRAAIDGEGRFEDCLGFEYPIRHCCVNDYLIIDEKLLN